MSCIYCKKIIVALIQITCVIQNVHAETGVRKNNKKIVDLQKPLILFF